MGCGNRSITARRAPRRPLVGLAVAFIVGTGLGLSSGAAAPWPLVVGVLCLVVAWFFLRMRACGSRLWPSAVSAFSLYAAVITFAWAASGIRVDHARCVAERIEALHGREVFATGWVAGEPRVVPVSAGERVMAKFPLRVERFITEGPNPRVAPPVLPVTWFGDADEAYPEYGERWRLAGRMQEGGGRHVAKVLGRDVRCSLEVNSTFADLLSTGHGFPFLRLCFRLRRAAADRLALGIRDFPETVALLHALLLGYREDLPGPMHETFAASGTVHIFAISGLHVAIFAMLIVAVLKMLKVNRAYWVLFLAPLLLGYAMATGAKSSALRACVMAIVFFAAPLFNRKADSFSALAAAALVILLAAPEQLVNAGFILSFVVVTGLLLLFPIFMRPLRHVWDTDPMRMQPLKWWERWRRSGLHYICSLAALSCAAWLASAPLTAYFFGRFTPIALIGNIVVIPLALLIVISGCLSLILGTIWVWFGEVFNHAAFALVTLLVHFTRLITHVPLGSLHVPKPPLWSVTSYYALLGVLAIAWRTDRWRPTGDPAAADGPVPPEQ